MIKTTAKKDKICALCRHWGDTGNYHIKKVTAMFVDYEESAVEKCMKTGFEMKARNKCPKFESKIG